MTENTEKTELAIEQNQVFELGELPSNWKESNVIDEVEKEDVPSEFAKEQSKNNFNEKELLAKKMEELRKVEETKEEVLYKFMEQERDLTWEFEGKKYDLFLANGTGGIGMPIVHPTDANKQLGVLSAEFAWEKPKAFLDHLDVETIDKASQHGDWTERTNKSMMLKNALLFDALVQKGQSTDFDDLGEAVKTVDKTRTEMLAFRKPVQSDLIQCWLNECHIERFLPKGVTSIDAFLSNPTEVYFIVKIGDYENPRHLLFVECNAPSDEQISAYQDNSFSREQNNQGDWRFSWDNEKRYAFAKKHITSVKGAMLGKLGELIVPLEDLTLMEQNNDAHLKQFLNGFNPEWLIDLGAQLAGAFNLGKK